MVQVGSAPGGDGRIMPEHQVFTSRLRGRPLLDSDGLAIGRIRDVVILPAPGSEPPRALGLVVTLQRRRIFVNLNGIAEISIDGAHLAGGNVDLDRFTRRTGEILASELAGKQTEDGTVVDVAIAPREQQRIGWEVDRPKASMFVWARYPEEWRQQMGSIDFSMKLLEEAEVAVSPGRGFGEAGEGYLRLALVENEHRLRQAVRQIGRCLRGEKAAV